MPPLMWGLFENLFDWARVPHPRGTERAQRDARGHRRRRTRRLAHSAFDLMESRRRRASPERIRLRDSPPRVICDSVSSLQTVKRSAGTFPS